MTTTRYSDLERERLAQELNIDVNEVDGLLKLSASIFDILKKRAAIKGCTIKEIVEGDIDYLRNMNYDVECDVK